MVTVFALAAALLYGSADFLGGAATRRAHVLSVLTVSAVAGVAVVVAAALLAGSPPRPAGIGWGICAGAAGGVGFMFFYAGLAAGPMSVVAPLSALVSTVLPVAVALAEGERPGPRVYAGALICVVAIISVSSGGGRPARGAPGAGTAGEPEGRGAAWTEERGTSDEGRRCLESAPQASGKHSEPEGRGVAWTEERRRSDEGRRRQSRRNGEAGGAPEASERHSQPDPPAGTRAPGAGRRAARGIGYGIAAGAAFGMFFLFIRNGGESGAFWPVAVARIAGTLIVVIAAAGTRTGPVRWQPDARLFVTALGAGVLDAGANVCYVLATRAGLFGLAIVLTSLYPGVTVLLARVVLGERTRWAQRAGLALAAAGVVLVTV